MFSHQQFLVLLDEFCRCVETNDAKGLARLFLEDGVYQDGFYGEFQGRTAIAVMLHEHFWKDAEGFAWDMHDAALAYPLGYATYRFSYSSKLEGAENQRVVFEGMAKFTLKDGLISRYEEQFNTGAALVQLNFNPQRVHGHLVKRANAMRQRLDGF